MIKIFAVICVIFHFLNEIEIDKKEKRHNEQDQFYCLYEHHVSEDVEIPRWIHDTAELGHMNTVDYTSAIRYLQELKDK